MLGESEAFIVILQTKSRLHFPKRVISRRHSGAVSPAPEEQLAVRQKQIFPLRLEIMVR